MMRLTSNDCMGELSQLQGLMAGSALPYQNTTS
jgi:hypothetical protein